MHCGSIGDLRKLIKMQNNGTRFNHCNGGGEGSGRRRNRRACGDGANFIVGLRALRLPEKYSITVGKALVLLQLKRVTGVHTHM